MKLKPELSKKSSNHEITTEYIKWNGSWMGRLNSIVADKV